MQVQFLLPAPRRCGRHIARSDFFIKQSLLVHPVAAIFQIEPAAQALLRFSPGYHGIFALCQSNAPFLARKTRPVFYGSCKQSAAFSAPRNPSPLREHHIATAYFTIRMEVFL